MAKPNIIFILSDQHRFCDVGYQGNKEVCTPNLDAMSEEGAYFEHAYSSCPVCVPARGSIFTGLHALHHGATANDMPVRTDIEGLGDVFKAGGLQYSIHRKMASWWDSERPFYSRRRTIGI